MSKKSVGFGAVLFASALGVTAAQAQTPGVIVQPQLAPAVTNMTQPPVQPPAPASQPNQASGTKSDGSGQAPAKDEAAKPAK